MAFRCYRRQAYKVCLPLFCCFGPDTINAQRPKPLRIYRPIEMVGVLRFELKASASRTQRATICAIPRRKTAARAAVRFGCGRRIRTLTMRVRVAGATITQFRIKVLYYYTKKRLACQDPFRRFLQKGKALQPKGYACAQGERMV